MTRLKALRGDLLAWTALALLTAVVVFAGDKAMLTLMDAGGTTRALLLEYCWR